MSDESYRDESFAGESGFVSIDNYIGTVEEAWFGVKPQYDANAHLMCWKVSVESVGEGCEMPESGYIEEAWPIGKNWVSFDGGETVEDPNKEGRQSFTKTSTFFRGVIEPAVESWDLGRTLFERKPAGSEVGTFRHAVIWKGLRFRFAKVKLTYGGEVKDKETVLPVEYLGAESESASEGGSGGAVASEASVLIGMDPALIVKLKAIRLASGSHSAFVDKCLEDLTEIAGDTTIIMALADENQLWKELA